MKNLLITKLILAAILASLLLMLSLHPAYSADETNPSIQPLPKSELSTLIHDTFKVMKKHYIEPSIVANTEQFILEKLKQGQYASIHSIEDFANVIGSDIRHITGDSHLSLFTINDNEQVTHILSHKTGKLTYNHAFEEIRYLDGNIGYLKFNKFHPDEKARETVDAAFDFLKQSNGMIIDLRDTVGGSPYLVQYILGYFFPVNTPLWEVLDRSDNSFDSIQVIEHAGHKRFHSDYPIWILTSHNSASATELFLGVMQANGKATLIGEVTSGAGFYVGVKKITSELVFRISLSKPVISANQQNWEKKGITPDIQVEAMDALNYAQRLTFESSTIR